jgi:hypothetical protein
MKRKMATGTTKREKGTDVGSDARADLGRIAMASAIVLVAAAVALSTPGAARAATYKWVDEKGVVHYTDKMPPDQVDKATTELSKQGVPVNKTDRALTPEQRRAKEQEAERAKEAQKAQEEIARRDRALVASYTNEAEIDLARNRALQTINNVILSSQAFSDQLTKRKVDIETKRSESKGKALAAMLDRELESIDAELQRQADVVAQKNKEATVISAKYDADKQRWRELSASKEKAPEKAANEKSTTARAAPPASGASPVVPAGTAKK